MKRHIQTTGIRQWAGEDLLELQSEPLKAIDNFFAEYGSCVLRGCSLTENEDGTFRMAPGLVALEGKDVNEEPTFMVVPFAGTESTTLPVYLTLSYTVIRRTYVDERLKQVAYDYQAVASSVKPEDGICLELSLEHFPRFTDVIQDPEHRFFTDTEREMLNQHDKDIERIDEKDADQDERLDGHDAAIERIDLKDEEQDTRLTGHDKAIERIDLKDEDQNTRLANHDKAIERINNKDEEQDGRLNGHDTDIKNIKDKNDEQDERLDDHDTDIRSIKNKDQEQDERLDSHDADIKNIKEKDEQQDVRLTEHDTNIQDIQKKDEIQDDRLDGHDKEIELIQKKDKEHDNILTRHEQQFTEHIKGENKDTLKLYKVAVDSVGHIQTVEEVVKKDIVNLGIPAQDTTYTVATQTANGLMSSTDKTKLNKIDDNANNYNHPTYTARAAGFNKMTVDGTGHVSGITAVAKADITALGIPDTSTATTSANGLMSSTDKSKLDGIATGANNYTHPTYTARTAAFNKMTVDATGHVNGVIAVTKADITGLGIPAQDTTYIVATQTANGLMSSTDKTKLDGVAIGANNYTHPSHTSRAAGLYKMTVDTSGHVSAATAVAKADITALGIPAQDTTYNTATTSTNGLMSSTDKSKLDGIATGANNYTHPAYTARTVGFNKVTVDATGHVNAITAVTKGDITALGIPETNTTYGVATTSANGLMSAADKLKLNNAIVPTDVYTTSSLANLPVDKYNIYREYTSGLADAISFASTPAEGFECVISIKNSQTGMIVLQALPNSGDWISNTTRIFIEPGKIEEISIRYIGGKYLVKATNSFGLLS